MIQLIPQERISERIVEHIVDVPVPQMQEQIVEVIKVIPQERVSERIVEQIVDVLCATDCGGNRGSCADHTTGVARRSRSLKLFTAFQWSESRNKSLNRSSTCHATSDAEDREGFTTSHSRLRTHRRCSLSGGRIQQRTVEQVVGTHVQEVVHTVEVNTLKVIKKIQRSQPGDQAS